jgi:hypothetical protein
MTHTMTTYTIPRDLFIRAFQAIDQMPAMHVRPLLNELEACAQDNERRAQAAAEAAQREQWLAEVQTPAQPAAAPAPT